MPKPKVSTTFNAVNKMKGPMNKMGKAVRGFAVGTTAAIGLASVAFTGLIREASKIEDAVAGFTPLLGGTEKANELVEKLNQTAATTPFQFANIAKAAGQLLPVMNGDIERTVETFRMLGDTAGGNAQKLDSITRGFTKSMLKGKVDMESLNMIAEAGVPIFTELSTELGVSSAEMFKMITAGKVTTDQLTDTFSTMTSEGGVFFKGMEIASKTLTGKLSTLKDNIALTAGAIGMQLLPTIKPLVDRAIEIAGKMREWVTANKDMINQKIGTFFENMSTAIKTLVEFATPLVEVLFKVGKELFTMLTQTEGGKDFVEALGIAFGLVGDAVSLMWKVAKPILNLMFKTIGPIVDLINGIVKGIEAIANFSMSKGPEGLSYAGGNQQAAAALRGGNDAQAQSSSNNNYNWQGNLNIKGAAAGSTFSQGGNAPPINVNMGMGTGGL